MRLPMNLDTHHKIKWTLYLTLISLLLFVSVSNVGPFSSTKTLFISTHDPEEVQKYVIVLDGGSTGTRIHVFSFALNLKGHYTLVDEYFEEVKPGLSSYAKEPMNAAKGVLYLLEKAKTLVPINKWSETPVALKATAGLRLLPDAISDSILDEVSRTFGDSPFLANKDSVTVLAGEDEGLYAWYTLNFLLERLSDANHSVATLDLGGGSTQVTFAPAEFDTLLFSPKDHIIMTKIQNKTVSIYTHSYLGLGLMSARHSILKLSTDHSIFPTDNTSKTFSSSCIHPQEKTVWKHNLKQYTVMGRKNGKYGFKHCYNKAVQFLGNTVHKPVEMNKREVYVLSYYFDRALDMGIIGDKGGVATVNKFFSACEQTCKEKNSKKTFLCLDCSYITAFLHHGLGFDREKELMFAKRIDGIETSWGLGAAFSMLA